jgi:hypothetical protein
MAEAGSVMKYLGGRLCDAPGCLKAIKSAGMFTYKIVFDPFCRPS